jgi:hypothetical protein
VNSLGQIKCSNVQNIHGEMFKCLECSIDNINILLLYIIFYIPFYAQWGIIDFKSYPKVSPPKTKNPESLFWYGFQGIPSSSI